MDRDGKALHEFMRERGRVWAKPVEGAGADDGANEAASTSKKRKLRSVGKSSTYDERSCDEDEAEPEGKGKQPAEPVVQTPTPGLPQPGDVFESPEAALVRVIQTLVPVYGISARIEGSDETWANIYCNRHHSNYNSHPGGRCHFCVRLELNAKIGRWLVDTEGSHFEHNHNRDARIVKDPTWRTRIRMELARKALGMGPFVRKERKRRGKMADAGEAASEDSQSEDATDNEAEDASNDDKNLKAESLAPQTSGLTTLFGEKHGGSFSFAHLATPAPTPSLSPGGFAPGSSRTPYALPPTFPHLASASTQSIPFAPVAPASPLASVLPPVDLAASFLAATNPAQVHLAQALVDAGFNSIESPPSSARISARKAGTSCSTSWHSGLGWG